jgi:hypothetical protein
MASQSYGKDNGRLHHATEDEDSDHSYIAALLSLSMIDLGYFLAADQRFSACRYVSSSHIPGLVLGERSFDDFKNKERSLTITYWRMTTGYCSVLSVSEKASMTRHKTLAFCSVRCLFRKMEAE